MTAARATRVREVVDPADPAVKQAHMLLARTFHRRERVTLRDWRGSMREKQPRLGTDIAWHLIVAEVDGKVVGFASGTYLGNMNLGVIGYLAISPSGRSLGLGTRLRNQLRVRFERDARRIRREPLEGIIGEVSAANPWLGTLARRPNVIVLNFAYYQPSLYEGDNPSPFLLYYESLHRRRDRLPVGELRRILYTVWRRVYRISHPLDRSAFRAMLRALEKRRTIGRHPVTRKLR